MSDKNIAPAREVYKAAREALAAHDDYSIKVIGADGFPLIGTVERSAYVIAALRQLIEAPAMKVIAELGELNPADLEQIASSYLGDN